MSHPFKANRPDGTGAGSSVEVADVFRLHISAYREKHRLSTPTHTLIRDVVECRTVHMGGRVLECDDCGHRRNVYNSCGNLHCPKCFPLM